MTTPDLSLLGRWIAARVRMTLRSPRALGFTFAFPLVLVTLFSSLNGDQKVAAPAGATSRSPSTTRPSIGVFALTLACYTSLIIGVATARETGLLKRVRGTPLPMPVYLGAWLTGAGAGRDRARWCCCSSSPCRPSACTSTPTRCRRRSLVLVLGAACLGSLGLALGDAGEDRRPGDSRSRS